FIKYIGDSEFWLRLPSAIAGILCIFLIFIIGKKIYSEWEGIFSSLFMAILWFPVYYSREARAYSLLLLFSMLSFYLWIRILENVKKRGVIILESIVLAISVSFTSYLHYFGLFFTTLLFLWIFIYSLRRKKFLIFLLPFIIFIIFYFPWIPAMLGQMGKEHFWIKKGWVLRTVFFLYHFFNRSKILFITVLCLLTASIFVSFLRAYKKRRIFLGISFNTLILILWLTIPFILTFAKSLVSTPVITIRNLIVSLPPAYLLFARSITELWKSKILRISVVSAISILSLFHLSFSLHFYSKPQKEQFREAVHFLSENYFLFENSLIIGYAWGRRQFEYYMGREGFKGGIELILGEEKDIPELIKILDERKPRYIWYLWAHRVPDKNFMNFIFKNFHLLIRSRFIGSEVFLFEAP
ncbi:MAG: glycosyltransferase family 39 protein, partial [Candidatus Aminicenantia bacterium]